MFGVVKIGDWLLFAGWGFELSPISYATQLWHDGVRYPTLNHFVACSRADLFNHPSARKAILAEKKGWKLAAHLKGLSWDRDVWEAKAPAVVRRAYELLFQQKPLFRDYLRGVGVEKITWCSFDPIQGNTLTIEEAMKSIRERGSDWRPPGVDAVGKALTFFASQPSSSQTPLGQPSPVCTNSHSQPPPPPSQTSSQPTPGSPSASKKPF